MYTITKKICTYSSVNTYIFSIFSHKHEGSLELTKGVSDPHVVYAHRLNCTACYCDASSLLEVLVVFGISENEIIDLFDTLPLYETSIKHNGQWHLLEQISDE